MGSRGVASYNDPIRKPPSRGSLPTPFVREFRNLLSNAFNVVDPDSGKKLSKCIGVYAFYDYDGEPIYVGQTTEDFGTRIGRHLRGQRSDTLAYRILDPFEVAEMRLFVSEDLRDMSKAERNHRINSLEYSVYVQSIKDSRYSAILNEKIPPVSPEVDIPTAYSFDLVPAKYREEREHPDVRIARRAETLARVAAVAHERGEVSPGLRRVIVIQAVRLADLAANRLAFVEGRPGRPANAIDVHALVGDVMKEFSLDNDLDS